jgi:hypothetical protein
VVITVLVAASAGAAPARQPLERALPGGRVDWAAGTLEAGGAGAPDARAPSPAIGRVAAERIARRNARLHLAELAVALPGSGRKTVAEACDQACTTRLGQLLMAEAEDTDVRYFSDGAVKLRARVPLEVLRLALARATESSYSDEAPSALVIDASGRGVSPGVAPHLHAGSAELVGPVIYHASLDAAAQDARLGPRPEKLIATAADGADLTLDAAAAPKLEAARKAGALIVIVGAEVKP